MPTRDIPLELLTQVLLFGNNSEIGQRLGGGGVDKAVRMAFGAVVALARRQPLFAVII